MKPDLREVPLREAINSGRHTLTFREGDWDQRLATAYKNGRVLLELDENDRPLRAYQKDEDE